MSATQYVNSIPIFQGVQGKYYIVDGFKYDIHFPLAWALDHRFPSSLYYGGGPKLCANCFEFGSIDNVFVGYCSNCLGDFCGTRGKMEICPGTSIMDIPECEVWVKYPYMSGWRVDWIGDKNIEKNEDADEYDSDEDKEEREAWVHECVCISQRQKTCNKLLLSGRRPNHGPKSLVDILKKLEDSSSESDDDEEKINTYIESFSER